MRMSSLIVVVLLLFTTFAGANMLTNASFEQPGGWTFTGNAGTTNWAPHSGVTGAVYRGWVAGLGDNRIYQDVTTTSTGLYTFAAWVLREASNQLVSAEMRLDFLDAANNPVQAQTAASFASLPNDGAWHQVYVTANCTNPTVAKVRATAYATWTVGGGPCTLMMDDCDLSQGSYAGTKLTSSSFENVAANNWRNSHWNGTLAGWNSGGALAADWWGARSGTNGITIYSWDNYSNNYRTTFSQNVNPTTTGTYFFSIYIKRESNALFSNAVLRISWYDRTLTNKVQIDSVSNLVVTNDGNWHELYVQDICTSPAIHEARCSLGFEWSFNSGADPRSTMIDDARFAAGTYGSPSILSDWAYHNGTGCVASVEQVPQTNVGSFLQVDYAKTNVTFYVLANNPDQAKNYPDETAFWQVRTSWQDPGASFAWTNMWSTMTKVGSIDVSNGSPFHGLPTSGSKTLDLWKFVWPMPKDGGGLPFTNVTRVYYAPFFKTLAEGVQETDYAYLLSASKSSTLTNNLGQLLGRDPYDVDYSFELNTAVNTQMVNQGFETPDTNVFDSSSGWQSWGDVGKDDWAARSGKHGARFGTWSSGSYGFYQNIAATGGTYTFAIWLQEEVGVDPVNLNVKLEWYNRAGGVLQSDSKSLIDFPRDGSWHHVYVTSTCTSNGVSYVRPTFAGSFNASTNSPSATMMDDVSFYQGSYTGIQELANGSLEDPTNNNGWRGASWYTIPNKDSGLKGGERKDWAWRSGNRGFALMSYTSEGATTGDYYTVLSQNLYCGTGTYTFTIWMLKEANSVLTNAILRLEWYDSTFKTKVQPDTMTNITALVSGSWTRFGVTGSCDSSALVEVRASLELGWQVTALDVPEKAIKIDDGRFVRGAYPYDLVNLDWAYHNATGYESTNEVVPGTNVGSFLQVNYARTTTTFYVLVNNPSAAQRSDETSYVGIRLYYVDPGLGGTEVWGGMTKVGSVDLSSGSPFHGLPSAGSKTLDLYRYDWQQPTNPITGHPWTNAFTVYYAPYIDSRYDVITTDRKFLGFINCEFTNNYTAGPQQATTWYVNKDYVYTNQWVEGNTNNTDGIPNWWWDKYSISGPNRVASGDEDGDNWNNGEEFVIDSDPTDITSGFSNVVQLVGRGVMTLTVNPSSTARVYDVYWKTNLMANDGWLNYNLSVTGVGGAISLTVTNTDALKRFYRTGVKFQ